MSNWYKKAKIILSRLSDENFEEITKERWIPVDSSFITDVAYSELNGYLDIRFEKGAEYTYADIPKGVFKEFMKSESKGQFYNNVIKPFYKMVKN